MSAGDVLPVEAGTLFRFAAADPARLDQALALGSAGGEGPCRAAIVAHSPGQLEERLALARRHLAGGPLPAHGVSVRLRPLEGDLALVFGGAGSSYPGMGEALYSGLPGLQAQASTFAPGLAGGYANGWSEATGPLRRLLACNHLCLGHYLVGQRLLGLRPQAVVGYSSGEMTSLFAAGIWQDPDSLLGSPEFRQLFTWEVAGALRAVARAWGEAQPRWETWVVRAPVDRIQEALEGEHQAHLSVIHQDLEGILAGAPDAVARVRARLGEAPCQRLDYDLAVHVPEAAGVEDQWLAVYRRPVIPQPGTRIYASALGAAYVPSREACARNLLAQCVAQLDFRRVVEAAYADGVRVFVEYGPLGSCSRWIRAILGAREALVVPFDGRGGGLDALLEGAGALWTAGVPCAPDALQDALRGGWPETISEPCPPQDILRVARAIEARARIHREGEGHGPASAPEPSLEPVRFSRAELEVHATGTISSIFGPRFASQDGFRRQTRLPAPPLLLVDRVTTLEAEPLSMAKGTIRTETEVRPGAWYLQAGHMPAGLLNESAQAHMLLISYLGVDAENRGERCFRMLGCSITYHGGLPRAGDTLCHEIHVDGFTTLGGQRIMLFHSECRVGGELRMTVRNAQAGFFDDATLANTSGCLWRPERQVVVPQPRLDAPAAECPFSSFDRDQVAAFAQGRPWDCFGPAWIETRAHTRTPRIPSGDLNMVDAVECFEPRGGPWGRGYLRLFKDLDPEAWFFKCHFHNDPCLPGCLMFESGLQGMAFFIAALGHAIHRDGWRFEPVQEEAFVFSCRGQAVPGNRRLTLEIFVEEVIAGPVPTLYCDLLGSVDGRPAFHARRIGLSLVPAWPLDEGSDLLEGRREAGPVAKAGGLTFDYQHMLTCAIGRPSTAFGPSSSRFDGPELVGRLPGPPYLFMTRMLQVEGDLGKAQQGHGVLAEYDIPEDAWYFRENGHQVMPFAVLLEAALQPCGWLAYYAGFALDSPDPLMFRNLDGTATLHREIRPGGGPLRTRGRNVSVSRTLTIVLVGYEVACEQDGQLVCTLRSSFGFFSPAAFEAQPGLPATEDQRAFHDAPATGGWTPAQADPVPGRPRLAGTMLRMIDRVDLFEAEGGAAGLGRARARKDVDPGEWFFKAHFFQDPVQPGSLGLEGMVQLLQWVMLRLGMDQGVEAPRFEPLALEMPVTWKYRGQVVPRNRQTTITLDLTARGRDERGPYAVAKASLWVDGKRIYEAANLGMRIVPG